MKKLNWGVLGLSNHYRLRIHLPLSGYDGALLYGIASRDGKRAAEAAEKLGFSRAFSSYQQLLDDDNIDAVYLPLPNHLHLEWIKKAADAGKHVICEKPLCLSAEEVDEAFAYCADREVFLMEAFMFRFHPQWERVKDIINTGEIGTVKSIQCIFSYNNTDPGNIRNQAAAGGGALRDIGCYGIAVSRFVMDREPSGVQSLIVRDPVFKTDELTSFMLDYGSCHSLVTVSTQLNSAQNVRITGTGGSIEVMIPFNIYNDVPAEVKVITGVGERIVRTEAVDQYRCEFENFTNAVLKNNTGFFPMMETFSKQIQSIMDSVFKAGKQ